MTNSSYQTKIVITNDWNDNTNFADYNKFTWKGKLGIQKNFAKREKDIVFGKKSISESKSRQAVLSWADSQRPVQIGSEKNRSKNRIGKSFLFLRTLFLLLLMFCFSLCLSAEELAEEQEQAKEKIGFDTVLWETDYIAAKEKAKNLSKNLLIYFYAELDSPLLLSSSEERFVKVGNQSVRQVAYIMPELQKPLPVAAACREFENRVFSETETLELLDHYVLLKLPIDAKTKNAGESADGSAGGSADKNASEEESEKESEKEKEVPILDLAMYQEMRHLPGLAIIDYENKTEPYYRNLVSILPFVRAKSPTPEQVQTFLTLPSGTLTQRTLIYAIRIHPERPLSTMGTFHPFVTKEALEHSIYQAKTGVLGHQNFSARNARIMEQLEGSASEICAQSWSGEGLFEAAIGCVRAWRSSSGHWGMARKKHKLFGYDMVLGQNGAWYATGLFVD